MAGRDPAGRVLVLGASGYVGGRLVPELLRSGWNVRCMTRSPADLRAVEWGAEVEIVDGDLSRPETLDAAFADVSQIVYLVHSLDEGDFEDIERDTARNARVAAEAAGVRQIIYLSGLGDGTTELSAHLRSRHRVGRELASGDVAVVELRAAIVIGAGSASFEMMRSLVEVLPVMITPKWVSSTLVQPIAIADVLTYLVAAVTAVDSAAVDEEGGGHEIIEIGGPDVLTYRSLMDLYAEVAGLSRRWIIPVPVLSPRLSAHWVSVVTPLPGSLSKSLISSLSHDVVVTDRAGARALSDHQPLTMRTAIEVSIAALADLDIPTRWSGISPRVTSAQPRPWDADWSGGTVYEDRQERSTTADISAVMATVTGIGGDRGWYGFGFLWRLRGLLDTLVGGAGLRRGRRHPDQIRVGEALDFWRVEELDDRLFRLRAEMRLPGMAWLEWRVDGDDDEPDRRVVQRARYAPRGLVGRLYWWVLLPVHRLIFPLMLRRVLAVAEQR